MVARKPPAKKKRVVRKKPAATEWTEGRKKAFITSVLRSGFRKWPNKFLVLKEAAVGKRINKSSNRLAEHYVCAKCKEEFPQKEIQIDHIKPIVGVEGFISWDKFIEGLFCDKENLQALCSECHKLKSKLENEERVKVRQSKGEEHA